MVDPRGEKYDDAWLLESRPLNLFPKGCVIFDHSLDGYLLNCSLLPEALQCIGHKTVKGLKKVDYGFSWQNSTRMSSKDTKYGPGFYRINGKKEKKESIGGKNRKKKNE